MDRDCWGVIKTWDVDLEVTYKVGPIQSRMRTWKKK